ncbi:MAG TPA: tRNA lysidine(34) synthetase TilS [Pyrinomonadaceae bacterium]
MYKIRLSSFARLLLAEWRKLKLPTSSAKLIIAVSGGADSTALLLATNELVKSQKLTITPIVAHLDHGIRKVSKKDARWVSQLAKDLGLKAVIGRAKLADENEDNLEQAAREARYEFLERTAKRYKSEFVLTGHTMDDQAETVLLRLMRGSSAAGLGGMQTFRPISKGSQIQLIRPILWARRNQTEDYCHQHKSDFLHDEMNHDERFSRVKVRKQLLPLMQSFNNKIVEAISRTATLLTEDGAVLVTNADALLKAAGEDDETASGTLSVKVLANAPAALRRRALRQWVSNNRGDARRIEMVHLLAVERLVEGDAGGRTVELPGGATVRRKRGRLEFQAKND